MYVKKLICENTGPLENLNISFEKSETGEPAPCVLVGENGSGKSIVLSYIADAFHELAELEYNDATKKTYNGHEYFKIISANQRHVGAKYYVSYIECEDETEQIIYYCKSGFCQYDSFIERNKLASNNRIKNKWKQEDNDKGVSIDKKKANYLFSNNVLCYFPPSRYEKPNWLGNNYYTDVNFNSSENYSGHLANPILVGDVTEDLIQWIFDIIADSRGDLELVVQESDSRFKITYPAVDAIILMSTARKNMEKIMSTILGQEVVFRMDFRGSGKNRLHICNKEGTVLVPSLDALSTGQMALFLLFATIARYADHLDLNKSIHLDQIRGVVIIDEIGLHLHSRLQREVLPKLMKLFPMVQFILSTHSPLVLLGLNEEYGDSLSIFDMPSGRKISVEQFKEFENAYAYYSETEHFREIIRKEIDALSINKPLIITEGATDWRHIKAAFKGLSDDPRCAWLSDMDFELLKYNPDNSNTDKLIRIKMSASELKDMVEDYCKIPQPRKMIFIADNDLPDISKRLNDLNKGFKSWGNNVFSLTLPVPSHRKETPNICIEHLYFDEDIKRWVKTPNYERRVFMGNEFDKNGIYLGDDYQLLCCDRNSCGEQKIQIIDGSGNKKVIEPYGKNKERNYALTKMDFAKMILEQKSPFGQMRFDGFIPLFEIIKKIINE